MLYSSSFHGFIHLIAFSLFHLSTALAIFSPFHLFTFPLFPLFNFSPFPPYLLPKFSYLCMKKMRITTVILDFDGTLGDSRRIIVDTLRETLRLHGLPQNSEDQCAATIGLPLKEAFVRLANVDDATATACVTTYRSIFDINNVTGVVKPFANVVQTIKCMHDAGLTLTIASSRGRDSLPNLVRSIGIGPYISYIVSADDVTNAKPHPEPVLLTLEHLGVKPEETLVVGDMAFDIEMGRCANTLTCGVTYGNGTPAELEGAGANWVIDDFAELLNII